MKHIVSQKLGAKSNNYKFVGYPIQSIKYYFYHPIKQTLFVLKYATFLVKQFILKMSSRRKIKLNKVQDHKKHPNITKAQGYNILCLV
jgi:hypothetical protein